MTRELWVGSGGIAAVIDSKEEKQKQLKVICIFE
jgi:hypothetical protein